MHHFHLKCSLHRIKPFCVFKVFYTETVERNKHTRNHTSKAITHQPDLMKGYLIENEPTNDTYIHDLYFENNEANI